ncbi:hypothetical protein BC938DRAFT_471546 [Jimgerdemannia flammicorona]|uniref:Protein kinase domain-containing protein n=1 Tax=Jimgerdemannia flammicorona TaxID=994334 RepID=A0A433Q7X8_9FUNG|nr:hypothetical protein BC938DRAFT_471546 [Jimgerdemannia flammicorona]
MIGANATIASRSTQRNQKAKLNADYQELVRELSTSEVSTVGCYVLGKTIGEGTYGKVKLGTHRLTGQQVAIKRIQKQHTSMITREIHHHRRLHHPNIARLYEILPTESHIYVVTEYCQNGELFETLLKETRFTERKARFWFEQLCRAVAYCHAKKVVHRDLKLENILLDADNNVKVCDFGFTREVEGKNMLDTFCGSAAYAAPEMIMRKKYSGPENIHIYIPDQRDFLSILPEADIWSLGIILFTLLTGELPFDDDNEAISQAKIIRLDYEIPDYLSDESCDLIQRILKIDPMERASLDQILAHAWFSLDLPEDDEDEGGRRESTADDQTDNSVTTPFGSIPSNPIPIAGSRPESRRFDNVEDDLNELTESLKRQREEIKRMESERKRIASRGSVSGASGPQGFPPGLSGSNLSSNRDSLIVPGSSVASPKTPSPSPPRFFGVHPLAGTPGPIQRSHFTSPTASPTFSPYRSDTFFVDDLPPSTPQFPPSATETRLMQALDMAGFDVDSIMRSVRNGQCDAASGLWFLLLAKLKDREEKDRDQDSWGYDRISMSPSNSSGAIRYSSGRSPLLQPFHRGQHPLGTVMTMKDQNGSSGSLQRVPVASVSSQINGTHTPLPRPIMVDAVTQTEPPTPPPQPSIPLTPYRDSSTVHPHDPPPSPTIATLKKFKLDKGFKSERSSSSGSNASERRKAREREREKEKEREREHREHDIIVGSVERGGWFSSMKAWFGTSKRDGEGYSEDEYEEWEERRRTKGPYKQSKLHSQTSGVHGGVVARHFGESQSASTIQFQQQGEVAGRQASSLEIPRERDAAAQPQTVVGSYPPMSSAGAPPMTWPPPQPLEQRMIDEAALQSSTNADSNGEITTISPVIYRSLSFGQRRRSLQLMQGPPVSELDQFEYSQESLTSPQYRNIHNLSLSLGSGGGTTEYGPANGAGRKDSMAEAASDEMSRPSSIRSSTTTNRTSVSSLSSNMYSSGEGYKPAILVPPATPPPAVTSSKRSEDSFGTVASMQQQTAASAMALQQPPATRATSTSSKSDRSASGVVVGTGTTSGSKRESIAAQGSVGAGKTNGASGGQARSTATSTTMQGQTQARTGQPPTQKRSLTPAVKPSTQGTKQSLDKGRPTTTSSKATTPSGKANTSSYFAPQVANTDSRTGTTGASSNNAAATTTTQVQPQKRKSSTVSTTVPLGVVHKDRPAQASTTAAASLTRQAGSPPNRSHATLSSAARKQHHRSAPPAGSSNSTARPTSPSPLHKSTTFVSTSTKSATNSVPPSTIPSPPSSNDSSTSTSSTSSNTTATTSSPPGPMAPSTSNPFPTAANNTVASTMSNPYVVPLVDKQPFPPAATANPQFSSGRRASLADGMVARKRISVAPAVTVGLPGKVGRGMGSRAIVEEEEEEEEGEE